MFSRPTPSKASVDGAPSPAGRRPGLWLLLALLAVAFLALPSLFYPFGRDQAMFGYIGDRWLHGDLPYRDAWDIKPPGIFGVYALAQLIFGRDMGAIRALDLVSTLATVVILFQLARRFASIRAAAFGAGLFGAAYFNDFNFWDSAQAESFAAPFAALYVLLLLEGRDRRSDWRLVAAGLCLGILALLKTTFILYVPLVIPVLLPLLRDGVARRFGLRALVLVAAGAIVPLGLLVLLFQAQGGVSYLVELLVAQKGYANGQLAALPAVFVERLLSFLIMHPLTTLLVIALGLGLRGKTIKAIADRPVLMTWLMLSLVLLVLQGRLYFYHWLPVLPPLAMLGGYCLATRLRSLVLDPDRAHRRRNAIVAAVILLIPIVAEIGRFSPAASLATGRIDREQHLARFNGIFGFSALENARAADYLRRQSRPDETILVHGFEPDLYYQAERASPTRHLSSAPIIGEVQIPLSLRRRWQIEQSRDARLRPPRFIVLAGFADPAMAAHWAARQPVGITYAGQNYVMAAEVGKFKFLRRDDAPPSH